MNPDAVDSLEYKGELSWEQLEKIANFFKVNFIILDHEFLFFFIEAGCEWLLAIDSTICEENWQIAVVFSDSHLLGNFSHSLVIKGNKSEPEFAKLMHECFIKRSIESMI